MLDPDHLDVTYVVDVPNALVRTAVRPGEPDPVKAMLSELGTGFDLRIDEQSVPLEVVTAEHLRANDDTQLLTLTLAAELPPGPHDLQLSNGNLPGVPAYFQTTVWVASSVQVRASTLLQVKDGKVARSLSGRWRMGDRERVAGVRYEVASDPPSRAFRWLAAAPAHRPIDEALPVPRGIWLRSLHWTPFGIGWMTVLAAGMGIGAAPPWRRAVPLAAIGGLALSMAPAAWVHGAGVVASVVAIGALLRGHRASGAAVAIAGLAAVGTAGQPGLAGVVALGLVGGAAAAWALDRSVEHAAMFSAVGCVLLWTMRLLG